MNIAQQIEQYLPRQLLGLVKDISGQAAKQGQRVYLVGGVVRDLLLGDPSLRSGPRFDLDLVVEGDAVKLAHKLGAEVLEAAFVIELSFLKGRDKLGQVPIHSLMRF